MRAVSVCAAGQSRKAGRSHCAATTASNESSSTPIVAASRTRSGVGARPLEQQRARRLQLVGERRLLADRRAVDFGDVDGRDR